MKEENAVKIDGEGPVLKILFGTGLFMSKTVDG